jgi:hypothetical protein
MAKISAGIGAGGAANHVAMGQDLHPSVTFLFILVIAEYAAFVALRYFFRNVHGG